MMLLKRSTALSVFDTRPTGGTHMAKSKLRPLALITGASGGIGESLAVRFARAGYDVALVARTARGLEATAKRCEALKATAHIFPVDLQDPAAGAALEKAVARRRTVADGGGQQRRLWRARPLQERRGAATSSA